MKSKGFLYVSMVLNVLYLLGSIIVFSSQQWLYEFNMHVNDVSDVFLIPIYDVVDVMVSFGVLLVLTIFLNKNYDDETCKTELTAIIILIVCLIASPICDVLGNGITSRMLAVTKGADALAAYSVMNTYLGFVRILSSAAMVFALTFSAILYGRKYRDE